MSKEVMKFFNDVCGEDLGHRFEIPNEDYLVLGEVPYSIRGGHPEPYTGIAIPLDGKINVSDDTIKQASKTRALGDFSNERKRIEQIFVSSFNKLRSATEKSYHLMAYSKNSVKTKDKAVIFFACDKVPLNDTLVREDIAKIINRILSDNTQIKEIYKNSAITSDNISRYGDVDTKNGPMTIFYIFMNLSGSAVDIDESDSVSNTLNEEDQPSSTRITVGQLIEKINEAIGIGKLKEDNEVKLMFNGNYYSVSSTNYDKTHGEFYLFFERDSTEYMTIAELLQDISSSEAENINAVIGSINADYEDHISEVKPTTDDSKPILGLELGDWKDDDKDMN